MKKMKLLALLGIMTFTISMSMSACGGRDEASTPFTESSSPSMDAVKTDPVTTINTTAETLTSDESNTGNEMSTTGETNTAEEMGTTIHANTSAAVNTASSIPSSGESIQLIGEIAQINGQTLIIRQTFIEVQDNGGEVAISGPDNPLLTVTYSASTRFIIRNVVNGGIKASDVTDTPATSADLVKGVSTIITGRTVSEAFEADEIVIYNFK